MTHKQTRHMHWTRTPAQWLATALTLTIVLCGCNARSASKSGSTTAAHGPVLMVDHITVGMTRDQVLAAASSQHLLVTLNHPTQLQLAEATATGAQHGLDTMGGGHGLILRVDFLHNVASTVVIAEQDRPEGTIYQEMSQLWGLPGALPRGWDNSLGAADRATWGDRQTVYAEYNPSMSSFGGQTVSIYNAHLMGSHVIAP